MQIVIDIPDKCYKEICNAKFPAQDTYRLVSWIKNGTPFQSIIENVKKEIINCRKVGEDDYWDYFNAGRIEAYTHALEIIDEHISGKENNNDV